MIGIYIPRETRASFGNGFVWDHVSLGVRFFFFQIN